MAETTLEYDAKTEGFTCQEKSVSVLSLIGNLDFCYPKDIQQSFSLQVCPTNLKPLTESHPFVHCQRVQHALDIFNTAGSYKNHFINTSQNINRMASKNGDVIPCLTPNGAFFSMRHKRYITGLVCSSVLMISCCANQIKSSKKPGRHRKAIVSRFPGSSAPTLTHVKRSSLD